jgi:hypothetical protein
VQFLANFASWLWRMPNPTTNSGIRDKHKRSSVADFLKAKINSGSRLSVVPDYLTIYAYDALREHLDQIDHLDFFYTEMPKPSDSCQPQNQLQFQRANAIIWGIGFNC